jgi:hypothetical protein
VVAGQLRKMIGELVAPTDGNGGSVHYPLPVGPARIPLNPLLGKRLALVFEGEITCVHCGRATRKSFSQGYCYPCFRKLAQCDRCIVQPELCHYAKGTCREPSWGETHCLISHTVYLANSSGLKVGITRGIDPRTRWIDQGAVQGLAIRTTSSRLEAGQAEVALKAFVADRTNWRAMLRGAPEPLDLTNEAVRLYDRYREAHGDLPLAGRDTSDEAPVSIAYPVLEYPKKVVSHDLHKAERLEGTLLGLKGQYLIFDTAVINVRKYGGYRVRVEFDA